VDKLASLEAEATMVHLKCIENTKDILTKDQLLFLLANKNKNHGKEGHGPGQRHENEMRQRQMRYGYEAGWWQDTDALSTVFQRRKEYA